MLLLMSLVDDEKALDLLVQGLIYPCGPLSQRGSHSVSMLFLLSFASTFDSILIA